MTGPAVPSGLEALLAEATPGPWERGDIWSVCGVMPERFGEGKCIHCVNRGTEPEWVGRTDINGTVMLAHRHRVSNPYDTDHIISGADGATVCGNYDYEIGGVLRGEDARLIALAPDAVRLLVDMAAAAEKVTEHHHDTCDLELGLSPAYPCSCGVDALRMTVARFAALDQRAGTA